VDIKLIALLIFSFVFELFFLSKDLSFKDNPISIDKVDVEFQNSKTYTITKEKIESVLVCDKIQQLKSKKLFFKPIATLYDENLTKIIVAKQAVLVDKTQLLTLKKNVKVIYSDKILTTQKILYKLPTATVIDSDAFTLKSPSLLAKGDHLFFDTKHSIIKAKNINYKINIKE